MGDFVWLLVYLIVFQETADSWNAKYWACTVINHLGNYAGSIFWIEWSDTYVVDSYAKKPCQVDHSLPHHRSFHEPVHSASAVYPQGGPCVDHRGSLSSQIPGFPQTHTMPEGVGTILCKAAPAADPVHTDMDSLLWSTHPAKQEEEGPSLGHGFSNTAAALST